MNERDNARYWEENAPDWVRLARAGFDTSRDSCSSASSIPPSTMPRSPRAPASCTTRASSPTF